MRRSTTEERAARLRSGRGSDVKGRGRDRQTSDGGGFVNVEEGRHVLPFLETFLEFEHLVLEDANLF